MGVRGKALNEKRAVQKRMLIDEIVADVCNGIGKSDCLTKLMEGIYQYATHPTMSKSMAYLYWNWAMDKIKFNSEAAVEEKRQILWNRYETVYNNSLELGQYQTARQCLTDMAKVFGLAEPEKREVSLDASKISFNFGSNV